MGGSQSRQPKFGQALVSAAPPAKGQKYFSEMARQQGKPDPFAVKDDPNLAVAPEAQAPAPEQPVPEQPVPEQPAPVIGALPAAVVPPAPVEQQMTNVTPPRGGAAKGTQAPGTPPVAMPVAGPQAAVNRPVSGAAAMQANQISTGANQFMAPTLTGITFGGS
jgi:hypothetical protein